MGVKPVEYKKDSSTQGFAVAGDEKVITKQNANTIKKDVDQGNTQDLDNGQERCLENYIDYDNIEYTEEENKNVGKNQINTTGEDGEDLSEKDGGKAGGVGAAAGAAAGAVGAAVATTILLTVGVTKNASNLSSNIPGGMILAGSIAMGGATTALALSFENTFDPNLGERKNQTSQAETNDQIIQQYYDELTNNMDSMTADSVAYAEAAEKKFGESVALIDIIGEIDAQIIEYRAQGNEAKVAELMKQKEQYKKDAEVLNTDDPDGMGALKENIELYASRNAEAQGVSESGTTVADFLKDGGPMEGWAKAAQIASYVGVLAMAVGLTYSIMRVGKDLSTLFTMWAAPADGVGVGLFIASGIMMGISARNFGKRADDEGAASDAGNQMAEYVAQLNENIDTQAGFTEETAAGYAEIDATGAEELAKTQEGVDKANKGLAGAVSGDNPPDNGDKPDDNPNGGDGAAAQIQKEED